jgi:hypothetical protein
VVVLAEAVPIVKQKGNLATTILTKSRTLAMMRMALMKRALMMRMAPIKEAMKLKMMRRVMKKENKRTPVMRTLKMMMARGSQE